MMIRTGRRAASICFVGRATRRVLVLTDTLVVIPSGGLATRLYRVSAVHGGVWPSGIFRHSMAPELVYSGDALGRLRMAGSGLACHSSVITCGEEIA